MPKIKWNLKHFFLVWFIVTLVILLATSPKDRPIRIDVADFKMPENEEIYFKNLRSFYYELEEREDAGFNLYRLKARRIDTVEPNFQLAIVQNWRQDQAYLIVEPNNVWEKPDTMQLAVRDGDNHDTIRITTWNTIEQYFFAANLYMALREEDCSYKLFVNKHWMSVLANGEDRLNLKTTLKDYFKLVGKMP